MSAVDSCFARPWVVELLGNYEAAVDGKQKAVPAQVVEFVKMQNIVEDLQCPTAVVHVSDRRYYIQAIITQEAKQRFEEEEEHFAFTDIKGNIIILKEFTVQFRAEEDLKNCDFYLRIQHFVVLPMETDSTDLFNCNRHTEVKKKIRTLWQDHMEELCMKNTGCSDGHLNRFLKVMNEENISLLKSTVLECLSIHERDEQPTTSRRALQPAASLRTAGRKAHGKKSQVIFSVPLNLLTIPAEEVVTLNNLPEWKDDFVMNEHGRSTESHVEKMYIEKEFPCKDSVAAQSSISSLLHEEQGSESKTQPELLPWDELSFQCHSIASSSAETQVSAACDQSLKTEHYIEHAEEMDHALPDSSTPDNLLPLETFCEEQSPLRSSPQDAVENESQSLFSPSSNYAYKSMAPEASDDMCKSPISVDQTCEPDRRMPYVLKSFSLEYVKSSVSLVPYNLPKVDYFEYYLEKRIYNSRKAPLNSSTLSSKMKTNASTSDFSGSKEETYLVASKKVKRAIKRKHLTEDAFPKAEEKLGTVSQNRSHKASSKNVKSKVKERPVLQKPILQFLSCRRQQRSNKATEMEITDATSYKNKTDKALNSK
uniref:Adrenocortical dysplasia protein homolog isoform X2 n=1 Tax=Geotrypetes seraphini TaxID=260995 RepID=A0A6P8PR30_GEOSA|nr:adrenocortical dysplasia protein homolog isoform X2 [Geotrypetes seraphini]